MKSIAIAFLGALLFASCTKLENVPGAEQILKSQHYLPVSGNFQSQGQYSGVSLTKDKTTIQGVWGFTDYFTDSVAHRTTMSIGDLDEDHQPLGYIDFTVDLSAATLIVNEDGSRVYQGTGSWTYLQSFGTLKNFLKTGAGGDLHYSVTYYGDGVEADYQMDIKGYSH